MIHSPEDPVEGVKIKFNILSNEYSSYIFGRSESGSTERFHKTGPKDYPSGRLKELSQEELRERMNSLTIMKEEKNGNEKERGEYGRFQTSLLNMGREIQDFARFCP